MDLSFLPAVNASLNAASAFFLTLGFVFIRRRWITAHKVSMLSAFAASVLFLGCYLTYHFFHGSTPFQRTGLVRTIYFAILISHSILAVVIVPLAITVLIRGLRGAFKSHVRLARLTLPIWLYVSVTGVVIYGMLYHL